MTSITLQNGFFSFLHECHKHIISNPRVIRMNIRSIQRCTETERQPSQSSLLWRDWWQHSGFLHGANWIHRSLGKVHEWDGYGLKTEGRKNKTRSKRRKAISMRQFGSGPMKSLPPLQYLGGRGGSIDNLRGKEMGVGDRGCEGMSREEMVWCMPHSY